MGKYIAAGSTDNNIYIFNSEGSLISSYTADGPILRVAISEDGKYIAAGSDNHKIYLIHRDGTLFLELLNWGSRKRCFDFIRGNKGECGIWWWIHLCFSISGNLIDKIDTQKRIKGVAFSKDEKSKDLAAWFVYDNSLYRYNSDRLGLGVPQKYPTTEPVCHGSLSENGEYLAVGSDDNKLYLFNLKGISLELSYRG